MLKVSTHPLH